MLRYFGRWGNWQGREAQGCHVRDTCGQTRNTTRLVMLVPFEGPLRSPNSRDLPITQQLL